MANNTASFVAGLAGGYMTGQRQKEMDEERRADRAMAKERHDAAMEEINYAKKQRVGLADAVAERTAQTGEVVGPTGQREFYKDPAAVTPQMLEDRRAEAEMRAELPGAAPVGLDSAVVRPGYGVNAGTKSTITTEAPNLALENSRAAKLKRVGDVMMANDPSKAMSLELTDMQIQEKRRETAKKLEEEGYITAARFARAGDAQGVFNAFNKSGTTKLAGVPTVTEVERDVGGVKIKTYDYAGEFVGEDGVKKPFKVNSHDLSMQILPYDKILTEQRQSANDASKRKLEGAQAKYYESRAENEDIRDPNLRGKPGGAGGTPRVDHYDDKKWTAAFNKYDKSITSLMNDTTGKNEVSSDLVSARQAIFNQARGSGTMTPDEASEFANTAVNKIRSEAMKTVEDAQAKDRKSTLTVQQVIAQMARQASQHGSQPASKQTTGKPPAAPKGPSLSDAVKVMPPPETAKQPPSYTPPVGSLAAKALQERESAASASKKLQEEQMMEDARQRIQAREDERRAAENYRRVNNIK